MKRRGKFMMIIFRYFILSLFALSFIQVNSAPRFAISELGPLGIFINAYTGNMYHQRYDIIIPTRGAVSLDMNFTYNSLKHELDKGYGKGWTFSFGMYYATVGNNVVIFREEGEEDTFTWDGTQFLPPPGISDGLLEYEAGKYRLTTKYGLSYYFESNVHKHLTKIIDRNNNTIALSYTDGKLTTITDPAGRMLNLSWVGDHMTQLTDPNTSPGRVIAFMYDEAGNLTQVTRPLGSNYQYSYDADGRMISVTDPVGTTLDIAYNEFGAVASLSCPAVSYLKTISYNACDNTTTISQTVSSVPRQTIYTFDLSGRVTGIQYPDGATVSYTWDADENMLSYTDELGNTTTYTYDSKGNMLSETDPLGYSESYTYESTFSNILTFTNKNGIPITFTYDSNGNLLTVTDYLTNTETYARTIYGQISSYTNKRGFTTTYTYNGNGNLTGLTDPLLKNESYTYDQVGNMLTHTNKRSKVNTFSYDLLDRLTGTTDALGYTTSTTYDANGNILTETDQNARVSTYSYDPLGRRIGKTDHIGGITLYSYDEAGNILTETDPRGNTTTYAYDQRDRLVTTTDCSGNSESYTYFIDGRIAASTDKNLNATSYTYDAIGRVLTITYPDLFVENYSYDPVGNKLSETDKMGSATTYTYDGLNHLISVLYPMGFTETYTYDAEDNKTSFTDKRGFATTYTYDASDRLLTVTDPASAVESFGYDENGNTTSYSDKNGNITTYSYDSMDRRIKSTDSYNYDETSTYDGVGNMLSSTTKNSNTTYYSYDGLDRLIAVTDPMGYPETYTYDANGNQLSITDRNGYTTSYSYDCLNRLTSATDPNDYTESYGYDAVGHRTALTDKNGGISSWTYSCCHVSSYTDQLLFTEYYGYDGDGRLTSFIDKGGKPNTFIYDLLGRMLVKTTPMINQTFYTYDGNGNPLTMTDANANTTSYTYNARNEMTGILYPDMSTISYTYDNNGNLLSAIHTGGINDQITYTYDQLNRLISTTTNYGSFSKLVSYTYDPDGNCTSITSETGIIYYNYDTRGFLGQVIDQSGQSTWYSYDQAGNQVAVHYPNGVSTYTAYDAMGNVLSVETRDDLPAAMPGPASKGPAPLPGNAPLFDVDYAVTEILTPVSGPLTGQEPVTITVINYGMIVLPAVEVSYTIDGEVTVTELITDPIPLMIPFIYVFSQTGDFGTEGHTYSLSCCVTANGDENPMNNCVLSMIENTGGGGGGGIYQSFSYMYDGMGNKLNEEHLDGTSISFGYSLRNELLYESIMPSGDNVTFAYGPTGLRMSKEENGIVSLYEYNDDDVLIASGSILYDVDNNGNRLSKTDAAGSTTAYTYGYNNELKSVLLPSGDVIENEYSSFGRILREEKYGEETYMLRDGRELLEELSSAGTPLYYYNPRLSIHDGTSTGYYYRDREESTTLQMDPSKAIVAEADYDEFGRVRSCTGSWMHDRKLYEDMSVCSASGLMRCDRDEDEDMHGRCVGHWDPDTDDGLSRECSGRRHGRSGAVGGGLDDDDEGCRGGSCDAGDSYVRGEKEREYRPHDSDDIDVVGPSLPGEREERERLRKEREQQRSTVAVRQGPLWVLNPPQPEEEVKPAEPQKEDANPKPKEVEVKVKPKEEEKKKEPSCPIGKAFQAPVEQTIVSVKYNNKGVPNNKDAKEQAVREHKRKAEASCEEKGKTACVGVCKDCKQTCKGQLVGVGTNANHRQKKGEDKMIIDANLANCKCVCK